MNTWQRALLIVAIVMLGVGEWAWQAHSITMRFHKYATSQQLAQQSLAHPALPPGARTFTPAEVHTFLEAAKKAEAIADPMQRCLAYPDPPHSHWSAAAVNAYCRYNLQPVISYDEAKKLIVGGHAADLDQRLARDLQAQLTQPQSHGLVDRTYFNDFNDGSFQVRQTLDAWKRASPSSAFAYAASGMAYVAMAAQARGGEYISNTPQSSIDAMDRLLQQADTDLQHAVALNPKLTPSYVAMIGAGKMSLGDRYTHDAATRGLAAAPDNYAIRGALLDALQPKWGGSLAAMARVARQAQQHVAENPLLAIDLSIEPAYRYDVCGCESRTIWQAFPVAFDNLSSTQLLFAAGFAANGDGHTDLAAIYLSEGLRFLPDNSSARMRRNYVLSDFGETTWAIDDANRWIRRWPQSPWGYSMRGYAYKTLGDETHAAPDLEKATTLDPKNTWPLIQLGDMYLDKPTTPDAWDKAWDVANRLVAGHPEIVAGWMLRARIETYQPRAGLDETARQVFARFGNDPDERGAVAQMKMLVEQSRLAGTSNTLIRQGTRDARQTTRATMKQPLAHG